MSRLQFVRFARYEALVTLLLAFSTALRAEIALSSRGKPRAVIIEQSGATSAEQHAIRELKLHLDMITGGQFAVRQGESGKGQGIIVVGPGLFASKLFPEVNFASLGPEEFVTIARSGRLLLAGGRPRGTVYAVNRFLQDQCGVRWWTPWATNIPHRATLRIPDLKIRDKPSFEYRGPYWYPAFDPLWRERNCANNETWWIPADFGGCVRYKGFCHTFYPLVPPEKYFGDHPEWYSMINGKRTHEHAQLCLTNPQLRDFVVRRVKEWLRECPDCQIVSVTQNDWNGACECPDCKRLDDSEGSHSGTMLAFANYIAEKIEPQFPNVAVDTFAYTYTRKPPKTLKARHNVIVRLCSIECNFREPLDDPSNAAFAGDIRKWSEICERLYVWDYTTDFKNYIHPHPNWFTLGPNIRFFQAHGVRGVFEQGAYAGYGAEMAELRGWLLAQLLWNPQQDDRKLIREFIEGYYGRAAARPIYEYLELMHEASKGFYLGCYLRKDPPHLTFDVLDRAEALWREAEKAVAHESEKLARVQQAHLPVRYAFLANWKRLRKDCWEQNRTWPMAESREVVAEEFGRVCQGAPGLKWSSAKALNEGGLTVEKFLQGFKTDPVFKVDVTKAPLPRLKHPPPPADLSAAEWRGAVDLQDNVARLYKSGEFAEVLPDAPASDRRAVWMPGSHGEWAFRIPASKIPAAQRASGWKVYIVARIETGTNAAPDSVALTAGVHDSATRSYPAEAKFKIADVSQNYRCLLVGAFEPGPERDIFVSPASNPGVKAIWIDRVVLVKPWRQQN